MKSDGQIDVFFTLILLFHLLSAIVYLFTKFLLSVLYKKSKFLQNITILHTHK